MGNDRPPAPWIADAHSGRITRLLLRVAIIDCLLAVIVRPALMVVASSDRHFGRLLIPLQIAGSCATVLLPLQCIVLWLLLRPIWQQQRLRREKLRRVCAVLHSEELQIAFQPVLSVRTGKVLAAEALSRFPQEPPRGPDQWFAAATDVGLGVQLELLALRRALSEACNLPAHLDVAVNLSPCALNDPATLDAILQGPVSPSRLIVEITEHCAVSDYTVLSRSCTALRAHGIRLAIDDAGSGYASFQHIVKLGPDIIKLDRALISGLDTDPARRALVKHMVGFAADCSAQTIAEGVETSAEMACVEMLHVDQVQGYWTGRPTTDPLVWATWKSQPQSPAVIRHIGLLPTQVPVRVAG